MLQHSVSVYVIYACHNTNNNKLYIGQTKSSLEKRWKKHLRDAAHLDGRFQRALRKYDSNVWKLEVLEVVHSRLEANKREKHWISTHDTQNPDKGYNMSSGGEGCDAPKSADHRAKIGAALRGRKFSDATRSNMSKNHADVSGEKNPSATLDAEQVLIIQSELERGVSKSELAKRFNVSRSTIVNVWYGRHWACDHTSQIKRPPYTHSSEMREHLRLKALEREARRRTINHSL